MTIFIALAWLIAGVTSFIASLKRIFLVIEDVFFVSEDVLKYATWIGMFVFHVVGGLVSLGITIYKHFQGE